MRFYKHLQSMNVHSTQHLSTASTSGRAKLRQSAACAITVTAEGPKRGLKMQGICVRCALYTYVLCQVEYMCM